MSQFPICLFDEAYRNPPEMKVVAEKIIYKCWLFHVYMQKTCPLGYLSISLSYSVARGSVAALAFLSVVSIGWVKGTFEPEPRFLSPNRRDSCICFLTTNWNIVEVQYVVLLPPKKSMSQSFTMQT